MQIILSFARYDLGSLLTVVLGTENQVMLNQQKSYGDIEISDVVTV